MKIFISAGEASGDALGAHLLDALKARTDTLEAAGMGGPMMQARGFDARWGADAIGVMGLVEVLKHLPRLFRLAKDVADHAIAMAPDVAVLIDVPDFNIRVAKRLTAAGIPVVFYVGPSVWAWRPGRATRYARHIRRLLVLFPFEVPIWERAGVDVVCVGHPLIDEIPAPSPDDPLGRTTVALLPGSRRAEIARHLPVVLEAGAALAEQGLVDRFVLPVAPTVDPAVIEAAVKRSALGDKVELVVAPDGDPGPRRDAIARADLALVASGTQTLETALIGRPQVVFYKVSWLTWLIFRPLVKVGFVGLVNLIAGREVAPELLQGRFHPRALTDAAAKLLQDRAARRVATEALGDVRARLGGAGAAARAADAVLEIARADPR